jgi:hypothetical protein
VQSKRRRSKNNRRSQTTGESQSTTGTGDRGQNATAGGKNRRKKRRRKSREEEGGRTGQGEERESAHGLMVRFVASNYEIGVRFSVCARRERRVNKKNLGAPSKTPRHQANPRDTKQNPSTAQSQQGT